MKPWKILVTARAFSVSGSQARTQLVACGCEVIEAACFGPLTRQQLVNAAGDCQAVIAATDPYDSATFQALPGLKLVARCGVGIDSVDLQRDLQSNYHVQLHWIILCDVATDSLA
jgi:D-3-phosphoglycerate dehydrogenase / 2-oxoglutarate reductase